MPTATPDPGQDQLTDRLEAIMGRQVVGLTPLRGGMISQVFAATLTDGEAVVVKHDASATARLDTEGMMLRYLRQRSALPVPAVIHAEPTLLVIKYLAGEPVTTAAEPHLAELLATLHAVNAEAFGFDSETLNGTLRLPNAWTSSVVGFFRDQRLRFVATAALGNGTLPADLYAGVERIAERLDDLLPHAARPSLIHSDVWRNYVLAVGDRVTGLIDPSVCYADAEQELAYMALANGFSRRFFDAYAAYRPIDPEFWRTRRYVYQLYPHLLHVYFFGAPRLAELDEGLRRLSGLGNAQGRTA